MTTRGKTNNGRWRIAIGIIITIAVLGGGGVVIHTAFPQRTWEDWLIHVDKDLAGLAAQVFPTILLALMLEGRIAYRRHEYRWFRTTARILRGSAVMVSVLATFMCLWWLGLGEQNEDVVLNLVVTLSTILLFLSVMVVAVHVLGGQDYEEQVKEIADKSSVIAIDDILGEIRDKLERPRD